MTIATTPRLNLFIWNSERDEHARAQFDSNHREIEARVGRFQKGYIGARPAASAATDRMFWLDIGNNVLSYCNGSTWTNLNAFDDPEPLAGDSAMSAGASSMRSRADHVHEMAGFDPPVAIGTANAAGVSASYARRNHVHEIGTGAINAAGMFTTGVVNSAALATGAVSAGKIAVGGVDATRIIAPGILTAAKFAADIQMPVGSIAWWPSMSAPAGLGWFQCDGSAVSRTTYADLFALIGTTFGVGNGTTTFNVPDLRGRLIVAYSSGETEYNAIGKTGGAKTVTLTLANLSLHYHYMSHTHGSAVTSTNGAHNHAAWVPGGVGGNQGGPQTAESESGNWGLTNVSPIDVNLPIVYGAANQWVGAAGLHVHSATPPTYNGSSSSTGGGGAHSNLGPAIALMPMIRY